MHGIVHLSKRSGAMNEAYQLPRTTNLAIPAELRLRVEKSAKSDSRKMKPQILILLSEALDARDKKGSRK